MEQIVDPIFGTLVFAPHYHDVSVGYWKKQDYLELMGGLIPLNIKAGTNGPTEDQRQAYLALKRVDASLRSRLQEATLQFYQTQREIYADGYAAICDNDAEVEEFVPILAKPEDVWGILIPNSWTILGTESADYLFETLSIRCDTMLSWHGCWDIEHGFDMIFQGDKFLGFQSLECFYGLHNLQAVAGDTGN